MSQLFNALLLVFLIVAAIAVEKSKDLLSAIIIFASYSLMMSVLWLLLMAPDVALTEAAIGAGITTLLFLALLAKTERLEK
jgi:energy-converting hydrogenase B subunit D